MTTANHLITDLTARGNPAIAAHSQRFFKTGPGQYGEGDRFLGIRVPVLRQQAKQYQGLPLSAVAIALRSPLHEVRLCALLILVAQYARGTADTQAAIYALYLDSTAWVNSWDLVDSSAHLIVGAHLTRRARAPLYTLGCSSSLWERRIAIIATLQFIRDNDFADTLAIAEILLHDPEDLIHKAVGWMLREVGNRDRATEIGFLNLHYRKMPRTMLRYAIEKLPEPLRQSYLKGTVPVQGQG